MEKRRGSGDSHAAPDGAARSTDNSGLCSTCANAPDCMYAGDAERPVIQCEEFTHERRSESASAAGVIGTDLCETCSKRMTCTVEKPDGGVWACADYA